MAGGRAEGMILEYRSIRLVGAGVPAAVLLIAYFWMALDRGAPDLSGVIVHESGKYTLAGTIFYFSHFLREIPTDVAMALFLAAGRPGTAPLGNRSVRFGLLFCALALCLVALLQTAAVAGMRSAMLDLLQFRTRDDLVEYGSHWRYHWLSTIWFGVAVSHLAAIISGGRSDNAGNRIKKYAPWLYLLLLSGIFGISGRIFLDVRYAGHQAREIMTHGLITLMIGLALIMVPRSSGGITSWKAIFYAADRTSRLRMALVAGVPLYLAVIALSGDVMSEGQSKLGPSAMIGAHFFEHVLDYLLVILLAVPMSGWLDAINEGKAG